MIRCNKCGFTGDDETFRWGTDFFQRPFVKGCPQCDNRQNPGDASMRMFGGDRPFTFIRDIEPENTLEEAILAASEAS